MSRPAVVRARRSDQVGRSDLVRSWRVGCAYEDARGLRAHYTSDSFLGIALASANRPSVSRGRLRAFEEGGTLKGAGAACSGLLWLGLCALAFCPVFTHAYNIHTTPGHLHVPRLEHQDCLLQACMLGRVRDSGEPAYRRERAGGARGTNSASAAPLSLSLVWRRRRQTLVRQNGQPVQADLQAGTAVS